jgi:hypothetical protein
MYVEYINFLKLSGANHVKGDDDDDTGKCLVTFLRAVFLMHVLKVVSQVVKCMILDDDDMNYQTNQS